MQALPKRFWFPPFLRWAHLFWIVFPCLLLGGSGSPTGLGVETGAAVVEPDVIGDPEMEALLLPYRKKMEAYILEPVGEVSIALTRGKPETVLGNVLADGIRWATEARLREKMDLCVMNRLGIRADLPRGQITRGEILEIIPFENYLVVLNLTADQVFKLAEQMVESGGEPVSGMEIFYRPDGEVTGVRVGGNTLDPNRVYRVLTIDYLAFGQGNMTALHEGEVVRETGLHYREMFFEYLEALAEQNRNLPTRLEPRYNPLPQ